MTPPGASVPPPRAFSREESHGAVRTAQPSVRPVAPPTVLTPAPLASALLGPPLACVAGAVALAAAADVALAGTGVAAALVRAVFVVGIAAFPAAVGLTVARARRSPLGAGVALAVGGAFGLLALQLVPGGSRHLGAAAVALVAALLAPVLWPPWQARWLRTRPRRVSLLAASVLGAHEAVRRLEAVPGLRVSGLLVPGCDPTLASHLLQRTVAEAVGRGTPLERRVVVSCPMRDPAVGGAIAQLVARGHRITSESAVLRDAEGRVDASRADPLNLLLARPRSRTADALSRALDVGVAATLVVVAAPLFLVAAVAVVVDSGFPILYRQRRVGRGGRPIDVLKFRSMRRDAEAVTGPVWASDADPRITRVGRFLRRYRIDELPQLFNVLLGQMALVGPRPERPHFCDALREDVPLFELRTIVRPGITGWAQVRLAYGASSDDARRKLEYDLYYVTRRSPWFDVAVLVETARVVLTGAGSR